MKTQYKQFAEITVSSIRKIIPPDSLVSISASYVIVYALIGITNAILYLAEIIKEKK